MEDGRNLIKEPVTPGEENAKADEERKKLLRNILRAKTRSGGTFPDASPD